MMLCLLICSSMLLAIAMFISLQDGEREFQKIEGEYLKWTKFVEGENLKWSNFLKEEKAKIRHPEDKESIWEGIY